MKLLQLSDLHLFADQSKTLRGSDPYANLVRVLQVINQQHTDADGLLLSGDLSQDESLASYQLLNDMLAELPLPIYYIAGNHDQPHYMQQGFTAANIQHQKQIIVDDWQLILLNTRVDGKVSGYLNEHELAFLQQCLQQQPKRSALIAIHHHCLAVDGHMDRYILENADDLFSLICDYPQVRLIVHGHVHQVFEKTINTVTVMSAPATCYQITPKQANCVVEHTQPGFRLLQLSNAGQWHSKLVYC